MTDSVDSSDFRPSLSALSDAEFERLLAQCEAFDRQWPSRCIEDSLADAPDLPQELLLEKLLEIEIEKRCAIGEEPNSNAYTERFPDNKTVVDCVFSQQNDPSILSTTPETHGAHFNKDMPDIPGYEVIRLVGQGGMGVVYEAIQDSPRRRVAIKTLRASGTSASVDRFKREVRLLAKLDHPRIVKIYGVGEANGNPYFSMQYVPCRNLASRIKDGPLPPRDAANYVRDIAMALHHAHENKILHRDVKPSNILITDSAEVFLTDFGVARTLGLTETLTQGNVVGTPPWISPEQARGEQLKVESDVYGLGALLYGLLLGHAPFAADDREGLFFQINEVEPVAPRRLNPSIPRDLETICLKCLEKSSNHRYPTAIQVADELQRFIDGHPVHARPTSFLEKSMRWCLRNRALSASLAIALLLLMSTTGLSLQSARTERNLRLQAEEARADADAMRYLSDTFSLVSRYRDFCNRKPALASMLGIRPMDVTDWQRPSLAEDVVNNASSWESNWFRAMEQEIARSSTMADHDWSVVDFAINSDATQIVSCDESGQILLWDLESRRKVRELYSPRRDEKPTRTVHHFVRREQGTTLQDWGHCVVALDWMDERSVSGASLDGRVLFINTDTANLQSVLVSDHPLLAQAAKANTLLVGNEIGGIYQMEDRAVVRHAEFKDFGSVTCLAAAGSGWIAGFDNGEVHRLNDELESVASKQLEGPICDFEIINIGTRELLAVACGDPAPVLLDLSEPNTLQLQPALFPAVGGTQLQALSYRASVGLLYAGSSNGQLIEWNLETRQANVLQEISRRDSRSRRLNDFSISLRGKDLPAPMRMRVATMQWLASDELLTGGEDLFLKTWLVPSRATRLKRLKTSFGQDLQIRFSPSHKDLLWGIGKDGLLGLVDITKDQQVDQVQAHQAGSFPDLSISDDGSLVATVSGDNKVALWTLNGLRIVPALAKSLPCRHKLKSVALSHDGEMVAAVDELAQLFVWDTQSGSLLHSTSMKDPDSIGENYLEQPFTGHLAFNSTDSLLAAYGASQTAMLFSTRPFQRVDEQIWVTGRGGTALQWSPVYENVLLSIDDQLNITTLSVDREQEHLERRIPKLKEACFSMTTTPDQKRIVLLEEKGRIIFFEAANQLAILELTLPSGFGSCLSFNASGEVLAVAGASGEIDLVIAEAPEAELEALVDSRDLWQSTELLAPSFLMPSTSKSTIAFSSNGEVALVATMASPSAYQNEGPLELFLLSPTGEVTRERIRVDDSKSDSRAQAISTAIEYDALDRLNIFFRRRTADLSPYDGTLHWGRRSGPNQWDLELVADHGNAGQNPLLCFLDDGSLREIFHFSPSGFRLLRSFPPKGKEDSWQVEYVGRVGDGGKPEHIVASDGTIHIAQSWRPENGSWCPLYSTWSEGEYTREIVDPAAHRIYGIALDAEENPVSMIDTYEGARLIVRREGNWHVLAECPDMPQPRFTLCPNGIIYASPFVDEKTNSVCLWKYAAGEWSSCRIYQLQGQGTKHVPSHLTLAQNSRGMPVVVFGQYLTPPGWIKISQAIED